VFLYFVAGHIKIHMEWYSWEQVNQWHRYDMFTNNRKCQIGVHHCDGLVEMIETDISFTYIRAQMREICTGHHVGLVGPTSGHVATCWHTGCHVSMTPHQSKRSTSRQIRRCHVFSPMIQGPTTRANSLHPSHTPGTDLGTHLAVTQMKGGANGAFPGSDDPTGRSNPP
jgi:hypothetical protein